MRKQVSVAIIAAGLVFSTTANAASTREMQTLDEWLKKPADQREPSYLLVRCAGLYEGMLGYMGSSVGHDVAENVKATVISLSLTAMKVRHRKRGGKVEDYLDEVVHDRSLVAVTYNKRMHQNYAASGQAFVDDPLISGDLRTCKAIAEDIKGKS
jgi:hypothetical protein